MKVKIKKEETKKRLLLKKKKRPPPYKFKVGDSVRVSYKRSPFERVYDQKFSGEIFTVTRRYTRNDIPVYMLSDLQEDPIKGAFYENELVKITVDKDKVYKIERILKYRTRNKKREALVKWLFYPNKFNEWLPASEIKDLMP